MVPEFCVSCGETEVGARPANTVTIPYSSGAFKVFAGRCKECRDRNLCEGNKDSPGMN